MEEETAAISEIPVVKVVDNADSNVDLVKVTQEAKKEEEETTLEGKFIKVEKEPFDDAKDVGSGISETLPVVADDKSTVIERSLSNSSPSREVLEAQEKVAELEHELESIAGAFKHLESENSRLKDEILLIKEKLDESEKKHDDLESKVKNSQELTEAGERYKTLQEALQAQESKQKELVNVQESFDTLNLEGSSYPSNSPIILPGKLMATSSYGRANSNVVGQWRYDVFLSFRGEDTRKTFVGHFDAALRARGLQTFKDDQRLRTGDFIPEKLLDAIEESRIGVVIFSENYADSAWCLDELVHINDCRKEIGLTIIPVFYHVDPYIVRRQKGVYDKAFQQHKNRHGDEKIQKWKNALSEIANVSGSPLSTANGDESKIINILVQDISKKCKPTTSGETNLVGINIRVQELKSILRTNPNDVQFIGIWGMGGAGKTTLASATYLQISNEFECSSFVERVRELSKRDGLPSLQEKMLSDILFDKTLKVKSLAEGKGLMCSRMKNRKVLIILDDVDDIEQMEALAAEAGWFGKGSRIIITTRDKILLERPTLKFEIYNASLLNPTESIQLFSLYAFGETNPPEDYKEYASHVVHYASGLPLVLKVLGSTLCGSNKDEWNSALSKLEAAGENKVFKSLKVSFDGLTKNDQKIFLDIACFFKGKEMDYVTNVLDSIYLHSRFGLKRLIQKSLIWVSSDETLQMHDRIQEMGWQIVQRDSVDEPGIHSRLWLYEYIYDVFKNNSGTNAIESIYLSPGGERFEIGMESFKKMNGLRLLIVDWKVDFVVPVPPELDWCSKATQLLLEIFGFTAGSSIKCENVLYLPNSLRWIKWSFYGSPSLPACFEAANLVGLEMVWGNIVCLWNGRKNLDKLRYINLESCAKLKVSPDLGWMPNLQTLNLARCRGLNTLHPSFAYHEKLVFLNCEGCINLCSVPSSIEMKSLETLILSSCMRIGCFPDVKNMKRLSKLHLDSTNIKKLPASIGELSGLVILDLRWLKELESLPSTICQLPRLKYLDVSFCYKLDAMQVLPSSIVVLYADYTRTFTSFPDLSTKYKSLWKISLQTDCKDRDEPSNLVLKSLLEGHLVANHRFSIVLSGGNIPKWFSWYSQGNRTHLHQPSNWYKGDLLGFALCASLWMGFYKEYIEIQFDLLEKGTTYDLPTPPPPPPLRPGGKVWLGFMSFDFFRLLFPKYQPCDWTTYDGSIGLQFRSRVRKYCIISCAIRPVYKEDIKRSIPDLENSSLLQNGATGQPWLQQKDGTYKVNYIEETCFTSTRAYLKETGDRHAVVSFGI